MTICMLEKSGDVIQGRAIYKGGHYSRKYGIRFFKKGDTIQGGKLIKEIRSINFAQIRRMCLGAGGS